LGEDVDDAIVMVVKVRCSGVEGRKRVVVFLEEERKSRVSAFGRRVD